MTKVQLLVAIGHSARDHCPFRKNRPGSFPCLFLCRSSFCHLKSLLLYLSISAMPLSCLAISVPLSCHSFVLPLILHQSWEKHTVSFPPKERKKASVSGFYPEDESSRFVLPPLFANMLPLLVSAGIPGPACIARSLNPQSVPPVGLLLSLFISSFRNGECRHSILPYPLSSNIHHRYPSDPGMKIRMLLRGLLWKSAMPLFTIGALCGWRASPTLLFIALPFILFSLRRLVSRAGPSLFPNPPYLISYHNSLPL